MVGTVSTGLTQAQIDSLPVVKYVEVCCGGGNGGGGEAFVKQGERKETDEEEEQCTVCRVEFEGEDEVKKLPCGHYYHPECVGQWLQQKKVCPQCSQEVTFCGGGSGEESGGGGRPPLAAIGTVLAPRTIE